MIFYSDLYFSYFEDMGCIFFYFFNILEDIWRVLDLGDCYYLFKCFLNNFNNLCVNVLVLG